jgi:hypothetical protein
MSERDNLTTRDLADPRDGGADPAAGDETAEDMPLTREDHLDAEAREQADQPDGEAAVSTGSEIPPPTDAPAARSEAAEPLLPAEESDRFERRWHEIQTSFVDEPRQAVEQADTLVAELMQELASGFSDTRAKLEAQWDNEGEDASTEDLRVALTRYRSFFNRLLSA